MYLNRGEEGASKHKSTHARDQGIEAQGREDVPGGHSPSIVIAWQAARRRVKQLKLDTSHHILGAIGTAREVVGPGRAKLWLIAHKGVETGRAIIQELKVLVQASDGLGVSTHFCEETRKILRHQPGVLSATSFYKAIGAAQIKV